MGRAFKATLVKALEEGGGRPGLAFGDDGANQRLPLRSDDSGAVGALNFLPQCKAETLPKGGVIKQTHHGVGDSAWRTVRHEEARDVVLDLLQGAIVRGRDDRKAGGTGLRNHMGHALAFGKPGEDIHACQQGRNVAAVAKEAHRMLQVTFQRQQLQLFGVLRHESIGTAHDQEQDVRPLPVHDRGSGDKVLDTLFSIEPPDPADDRRGFADAEFSPDALAITGAEFGEVNHGRDFDGIVFTAWHFARSSVANGAADADIAVSEMLWARQCLRHEAAMFDQWRPQVSPLEGGIDVGHVLARDDDVVCRDLAGEIGDRILKRERIGHGVDIDAERPQLLVGLGGHAGLVEAGDDIDLIALWIEGLRKQANFGFFAADNEPCDDKENTGRFGGQSATLKTICRNSGRFSTSSARNAGPSSNGTTWVMTSRRTMSPTSWSKAMVSPASRRR